MKRSLLFFALVLASYGTIQAQVTTSSVTGVVTQSSGQATPGATIRAVHTPSGTVYSSAANDAGRFNLANMRVGGPYRIEVTYVGQDPVVYDDVYLQLGQPFVLNAVFGDATRTLEEVAITGPRAINTAKTGASTAVGQKQLKELPQINRSILDFTRLTPQSTGASFAGRDARYNNFQVDGANFNNGFGTDANNPLPGGNSQPISLDAIEQITVNIAPFDVTQSGFTGAGINAVTRSGTNRIEGSAYYFMQNQNLQGRRIGDVTLERVDAAKRNFGFRLGGPIIKDKLFLFINAEREESTGANASGSNLWRASENGVAIPEENISRTSRSDLEAVRNHLINQWGYDPGRYEGYADEAKQSSTKFLARLDWNINDVHKLALRYNQVIGNSMQQANAASGPFPRAVLPAYGRVGQNSITFENGNYGFQNVVRSITAELNSSFSSRLNNQFLATYTRIQDRRTTPSNQLFPFVDIGDGTHTGPSSAHQNYMSFGTELFSFNNDVVNNNYSFINNLNLQADKHNFTFGAAFEIQNFGNSFVRMGTSYYRYRSVEDFLTTGGPNEVAPINFGLTYPYEGRETYARVNFGLASLYAQDRWTVNDQLTLTYGVRAEMPIYMNKLTPNPSIDALRLQDVNGMPRNYDSGLWPKSQILVSPRFGVNYDVFGDRSLVLRGGTGFFSGRVPFVWLTNMPTGAGVLQNTIEQSYADVAGWIGNVRFNPERFYHLENVPAGAENVFIREPREGAPTSFSLVDRNFKMPMVWRTSIGGDYKVPNSPFVLTGDFLYTRDINAVFQFGANLRASNTFLNYGASGEEGDFGDNRPYYPNNASARFNPAMSPTGATVLTNTNAKGHAVSATIGLSVPNYYGFSGSVFYTYSDAREVSSNSGSSAVSAWGASPNINSPNDQFLHRSAFAIPHRIVANVSYRFEYANSLATTLGVYYNGQHQGRFSYTYGNDLNGDGVNSDLIYLPKESSSLNFQQYDITFRDENNVNQTRTFTSAEQLAAFDQFISDNNLESYRGSYLPRNGFLRPWLNNFDVRVLQDIFTNIGPRRHSLQFSADIINFGNLLNKSWGIQEFLNNSQQLLGTNGPISAEGVPTFRMRAVNNELPSGRPFQNGSTFDTTYKIMFGLRYTF